MKEDCTRDPKVGNLSEIGVNQDPLYQGEMGEEWSSQQEGVRVERPQSWPH